MQKEPHPLLLLLVSFLIKIHPPIKQSSPLWQCWLENILETTDPAKKTRRYKLSEAIIDEISRPPYPKTLFLLLLKHQKPRLYAFL
jgi:hypothetical protein